MQPHETLPIEIISYIKSENIKVTYLNLENILGFLYIKNIGVSKNINFYKARFCIAHETAHYYYGDLITTPGISHWKSIEEKKADILAMKVLLPKKQLLEEYEKYEGDLTILEKVFGVEMNIIEKRLKSIL